MRRREGLRREKTGIRGRLKETKREGREERMQRKIKKNERWRRN